MAISGAGSPADVSATAEPSMEAANVSLAGVCGEAAARIGEHASAARNARSVAKAEHLYPAIEFYLRISVNASGVISRCPGPDRKSGQEVESTTPTKATPSGPFSRLILMVPG